MSESEKNVPKRRFKEFENAEEWEQRKLGELADIVRGASPRPIQDPKWFDDKSTVGWLRISDVSEQDGRIYYLEQHISKAGQEKTRVLMQSHLLLSIAASVGKPVINYVSTGVHDGFLIFQNPTFDREFMFQWMKMFEDQWQKYGQPGSQVNLNSDIVKNQVILIPKEEEQVKIGTFFSDLDNLITLHQRKLEKMKSLKKAYLTDMFPAEGERKPKLRFAGFTDDWEQREFSDIFNLSQGLQIEISKRFANPGENMYFYITNEFLKSDSNERYYIYNPPVSVLCDESDILMTRTGNTGIVVTDVKGCFHNNFFKIKYEPKNYDKHFICQYLSTPNMQKKILNSAGSSTIPDLSHKSFYKLLGNFPDIIEQKRISDFLINLDNLITLHQHKLEKLQDIRKAYLNEMFI